MKTLAIIGQKGGTGKTTLAQILLVAFERAGFTACGFDLDPQTSLSSWGDLRDSDHPVIMPLPHSRLSNGLEAAEKDGVDVTIIDTAGRAERAALDAAKAADLVLLPLQPTSADLMTANASADLIKMAGDPMNAFLLVRVRPQGTRHKEAADFLEGNGLSLCPATLGERVTYQDAAAAGQTPQEFDPDSKAALECDHVFKFTCEHLNMSTTNNKKAAA